MEAPDLLNSLIGTYEQCIMSTALKRLDSCWRSVICRFGHVSGNKLGKCIRDYREGMGGGGGGVGIKMGKSRVRNFMRPLPQETG